MAADFTQDDFRVYLDRVDTLLHQFSGGVGMGGGGGGGKKQSTYANFTAQATGLSAGVKSVSESLKVLHGSTSHAASALSKIVGWGALGSALMGLVGHIGDTMRVYGKLNDVGESFGGSMFEMQKQAGDSGLTLEAFASSVTKGSQVIASMGTNQLKAIQDFNAYQKGVRNSLSQFGFYGMSLSDLTDVTSDYAETLRVTGKWEKLKTDDRIKATSDFIKSIQGLADVAGQSRDEMLKQANDLKNNPDMASALADMSIDQQKNFQAKMASWNANLGPQMGELLGDIAKYKGQAEFSPVAAKFREAGLQSAIDTAVRAYQTTQMNDGKGQKTGSKEFFDEQKEAINGFKGIGDVGGQLQKYNAEMYSVVQAKAAFRGKEDTEADAIKYDKAQKERVEATTLALETFKSNLELVTGSFRKGFYDGIIQSMYKSSGGIEVFTQRMDRLQELLGDFGKSAGVVFSLLVDIVPVLVGAFEDVVYVLGKVQGAFETVLGWVGLGGSTPLWEQEKGEDGKLHDKKDNLGNRIPVYETNDDGTLKKGKDGGPIQAKSESYAKIIASTLTIGLTGFLAIWAKRKIASAMHMNARDVYLSAKTVIGAGGKQAGAGYGGGGQGELFGEKETKSTTKGRMGRFLDKTKMKLFGTNLIQTIEETAADGTSKELKEATKPGRLTSILKSPALRTTGKIFGGALAGYVGGAVLNAVIDQLPDSDFKSMTESVINIAGPVLGLAANFGLLGGAMKAVGPAMKGIMSAGGSLISFVSRFAVAMVPAIASAWAFTAALLANPITWVVAGIAALIAAGVLLYEKWDWVKKQMGAVFDWFGNQSGWVQALIMALNPFIFVPLKIYQSWGAITGFFSDLWAGVKQSTSDAWHPAQWVIDKSSNAVSSLFDIWGPLTPFFTGLWNDITKQFAWAWKPIQSVIDEWKSVWHWIYGGDKPPVTGKLPDAPKPVAKPEAKPEEKPEEKPDEPRRGRTAAQIRQQRLRDQWDRQTDHMARVKAEIKADAQGSSFSSNERNVLKEMLPELAKLTNAGITPPTDEGIAIAIRNVLGDPNRNILTAPINDQTDSFESMNQRLLDTVALIQIDRDKERRDGVDPKLDREIQTAQLEQLQLQNALLMRGNNTREDMKRTAASPLNQ